MRILMLTLVCIAAGFGIAKYTVDQRTSRVVNTLGLKADMEASLAVVPVPKAEHGRIEVVGGDSFDFGTMKQGSTRSHKFVFKNVGGSPVQLEFKSSTCKCTVGKFKGAKLEPEQQTDVDLEWHAEKGVTEFSQTATIASDVIGQEEIKLSIHGKIGKSFVFDPPDHDFGDFLANEEYRFSGKLYSFEETPIKVNSGTWSDATLRKNVQVEIGDVRALKPGEVAEFADARQVMDFKVTLSRGVPSGRFAGNVALTYSGESSGETEQFNFPVRGRSVTVVTVVGGNDYNEEKNTLSLGSASSNVGLKKSFLLKVKNEGDVVPVVKLGKITPNAAADVLKVKIGEPTVSASQRIFPVTLEVPPGSPACEMAGAYGKDFAKIVLETNIESVPEFPMFIKFRITD